MKFTLLTLTTLLGLTSATQTGAPKSISATSKVGQKVLSAARRLQNDDNAEIDYTWVANMSLKFQGCHTTTVWNEEANGDEDVKISNQNLVRFRLCPADSCSMESAAGCASGYGDYIIDMETYLQAYLEGVQQDREYNCEYEKENGDCVCDEDGQDDGFDRDICEYDCFMSKGMEYCVDRNPYQEEGEEEEEEEEWELQQFAECQEYKFENDNNNNGNNGNNNGDEELEYFIGAYCASNGGSIHVGLFTDDTCSNFADSYGGKSTFLTLSGKDLPYADTTLVGTECFTCMEPKDADQNNENDQQDDDEVKETCEQLYEGAGKCEAGLGINYPNTYACSYMEGIKIQRKSGKTVMGAASSNGTASVFIGLFACTFVALGGYAVYLKQKLSRAQVDLVQE